CARDGGSWNVPLDVW
nr:immunoglobulin heavy chain junction region [Macaca mulatta]